MKMDITKIKNFFTTEMWQKTEYMSKRKGIAIRLLQKFYLTIKFFIEREHITFAAQLSFSTIMAIVPIAAMIFAVANGFGFGKFIETQFREMFSAQPEVANWLLTLTQSYLTHAKTGIFIGIGLLIMLYSVFSLINTVERVFDSIWQVKGTRPISRILIDYTAMMFLVPISIIIMSGLSIYLYSFVENLNGFLFLGTIARFSLRYLLPWTILTFMFVVLYVFMPNAKVQLSKTIGPAVLASLLMLALQGFYIHGQVFLTSYNAVYGSFAALPLFMLWMLMSWYICLFCAELCYINQNLDYYQCTIEPKRVCYNHFLAMSATVLSYICQRFANDEEPYTALELEEKTGIPIRVTMAILDRLQTIELITENHLPTTNRVTYTPTHDTNNISVGELVDRMGTEPTQSTELTHHLPEYAWQKDAYKKVETIHKNYLNALKNINIKELVNTQT
ncbi:YihY/virulence factor BrkB family protein [Prevotella pallens]|uniref:YihY/virulence factor BrkB family protein n=1 Tax=Prevotella pallens TaxID=60133 RepID=UPI0028E81298|nr:YihY/virulence factor BrkB family protein [Prevotella pallens]